MQTKRTFIATILLISLTVAGCQNEASSPQSSPTQASPDSGTAPEPVSSTQTAANINATTAPKTSSAIYTVPAEVSNCNGAVVTVKWDATKAGVSTEATEVWVGYSASDGKLFAAGGTAGEAQTGPWARPGSYFLLKNKVDGKEIGHAVIGGPACQN